MERIDTSRLSAILIEAPAWARVGLTHRDQRMRERAADAIAATITERLSETRHDDPNQLRLPIL